MTMKNIDEYNLLESMSFKRSQCAVACSLDLIGDKWTLLIIRDLFFGKTRFKEFQESDEKIPTNILADRLKKLESYGLITKTPYQQKPVRYQYQLTETGQSLDVIIKAILQWAGKQLPNTIHP
jgi:DNA-binding HxlR family transcriptional regulator